MLFITTHPFISRDGRDPLLTGDYLGELTNKLECKEVKCTEERCPNQHFIQTFVSNNYSYELDNSNELCKVRGFILNYANSQLINSDT